MGTIDKIKLKLRKLSKYKQEKVLEYIENLNEEESEMKQWNNFSLDRAMEGLDDDQLPEYSEHDLKERWN